MFINRNKRSSCSICGEELEDKCGMKYKMNVKRYSPDGYFCVMPKKGVVCENCLKKLRKIVLEYESTAKEASA